MRQPTDFKRVEYRKVKVDARANVREQLEEACQGCWRVTACAVGAVPGDKDVVFTLEREK